MHISFMEPMEILPHMNKCASLFVIKKSCNATKYFLTKEQLNKLSLRMALGIWCVLYKYFLLFLSLLLFSIPCICKQIADFLKSEALYVFLFILNDESCSVYNRCPEK